MARIFSARDRRFGGYLDDYEPGDIYEHWPGKTITAAEDHMFCMLTMAASPLHVDRHWAESETEFGRNVVVGTFIYSLLLGMSLPDISGRAIASLGVSELRHTLPFYHNDTLYGVTEILSLRASQTRSGQGILTVRTDGFNIGAQEFGDRRGWAPRQNSRDPVTPFWRAFCLRACQIESARPSVGVDETERTFLAGQINENAGQNGVLEHVGEIAGMKGMAIVDRNDPRLPM